MANADDEEWNALLRQTMAANRPPVDAATSAARGGLQGLTSGFADEAAAGIETAASKIPGVRSVAQWMQPAGAPRVDDPNVTYEQRRDYKRGQNAAAQQDNPNTYAAGQVAGGVAQALVPVGKAAATTAQALKTGAVAGGVAGAGYSNAQDAGQLATDTLKGAAVGAGSAAVGQALGGVVKGAPKRVEEGPLKELTAEAKQGLKDSLWVHRDTVKKVLADDSELRRSLGKPAEIARVIEDRAPKAMQENAAAYAAADKAVGGGMLAPDVLAPLNVLRNEMVRTSKHSGQVAAVDKVIDEFRNGLGRDPGQRIPAADVRSWITERLLPVGRAADKEASNLEAAESAAYNRVRDTLTGYVRKNAGEAAAGTVQANNQRIATYVTLGKIAERELQKESQGPGFGATITRALKGHNSEGMGAMVGGYLGHEVGGYPGAIVGGMVGAKAGAKVAQLGPVIDKGMASPAGQAIGRGAAAMPPALSQPVTEALTAGDRQKAIDLTRSEVYGD